MTDKEKLLATFDEIGLGYKSSADPYIRDDYGEILGTEAVIPSGEMVGGYFGFAAAFCFDEAGEFVGLVVKE